MLDGEAAEPSPPVDLAIGSARCPHANAAGRSDNTVTTTRGEPFAVLLSVSFGFGFTFWCGAQFASLALLAGRLGW